MMPKTLSSRLTLWYMVSFTVLLGCAFLVTWLVIDRTFDNRLDDELVSDFEEHYGQYIEGDQESLLREIAGSNVEEGHTEFVRLLDYDGQLISGTKWVALAGREINLDLLDFDSGNIYSLGTNTHRVVDGDDIEVVEFRELIAPLNSNRVLHLGESLEDKQETMGIMRNAFSAIFGLIIPFIGYIGWLVARNAVAGVVEVSNTAQRIHGNHLDERVDILAKDAEVAELAETFNGMLDRIRDLVREMQEMTDNIAHDLKTPLARIRFMAEVALSRNLSTGDDKDEIEEMASRTIEECDRLLKMIDISLDVAEAEAGINQSSAGNVNLSALVLDACELFEPVAEDNAIAFNAEVTADCFVCGNQHNLQRVVANLLDNAFKYTNAGGRIDLLLNNDSESVRVIVSDSGVGISQDEKTEVFKRFYRCDRSRSREGCGLGLSFCLAIARQCGGDIVLESTKNIGSVFTLTLPRVADDDIETDDPQLIPMSDNTKEMWVAT